jgi:hypothetical protein
MKTKILLAFATAATLASCSTFKSGQTPDDVYYSETKTWTENENKKEVSRKEDDYNYEDRALKMSVSSGRRWSTLESPYYSDDYRYDCICNCNKYGYYNSYGYRSGYYGYNSYNNFWGYNNYYTPIVVAPAKPKYVAPRGGSYSSNSYNNNTYNNKNNTTNSKSGGGGLLNRVFGNGNNDSGSSSNPRAYNPGSSSSNSSSGSSGRSSGGGVSRPGRNGD